jgi:hypothetical protein
MTADEFRAALSELRGTQEDLGDVLDVTSRTVRRWCSKGCRKHIDVVMDALLRLHRVGLPWRKSEIAISLNKQGRVVQLTDEQAIKRHKELMAAGATR